MTKLAIAFAMAGLLLPTGFAAAAELAPGSGESVRLGRVNGAVYYTVEQDGYRVVATIAEGDAGVPVRFVATLGEGQALTISVPGNIDEAPQLFEFSRANGRLFVDQTPKADEPMSISPVLVSE